MGQRPQPGQQVAGTLREGAARAVGHAAGAVVAPKTARSTARTALTSPTVVAVAVVAALAVWVGRRRPGGLSA